MKTTQSSDSSAVETIDGAFQIAETNSIKLAAKGRLVAIGVFAVYSVSALSGALLYNTLIYLGGFTLIALVLLLLTGSRFDRPWIKYVAVLLEVVLLAEAVLTPNPFNPEPWPDQMVYRYDNFYYFFVLIAVVVFSYSPALVLWAGASTALVWGIGIAWIASLPDTRYLTDLPAGATNGEVRAAFMDPYVVIMSARIKEIVAATLVSVLLATTVWRGRRTVQQLFAADNDRRLVQDLFGRYVPAEVAQAIIKDRGVLAPEQRIATVVFVDIADFTAIVERMSPRDALDMLNAYFSAATQVIGQHGGVVTQFQGDAILASFNVPIEADNHAEQAVRAAREILELVERQRFNEQRLRVRIGINTGALVAGSVGGGARMFYTVHGDAVNAAARLEELSKERGVPGLVGEDTVACVPQGLVGPRIGEVLLRGRMTSTGIYMLTATASSARADEPDAA